MSNVTGITGGGGGGGGGAPSGDAGGDLGSTYPDPQVVATHLTAPLPVAQGGTGAATLGAHGVLLGNGTGPVAVTGAGTAGQILTSGGASADPTFQAPTIVIRALDDNYTLVSADSGSGFNIRLVGGSATITLFAATSGFWFEAFVATTDEVTIQFIGSQVCYLGATPTSAGGTLKSSTKGSKVRVVFEAPNLFSALSSGTWAAA